jgi:hypothetical protein
MFMTTMEKNQSSSRCETLPPAGEHVVVHCPEFSCLGYLDQNGTWRGVFTDEALPGVIGFSPIS